MTLKKIIRAALIIAGLIAIAVGLTPIVVRAGAVALIAAVLIEDKERTDNEQD